MREPIDVLTSDMYFLNRIKPFTKEDFIHNLSDEQIEFMLIHINSQRKKYVNLLKSTPRKGREAIRENEKKKIKDKVMMIMSIGNIVPKDGYTNKRFAKEYSLKTTSSGVSFSEPNTTTKVIFNK